MFLKGCLHFTQHNNILKYENIKNKNYKNTKYKNVDVIKQQVPKWLFSVLITIRVKLHVSEHFILKIFFKNLNNTEGEAKTFFAVKKAKVYLSTLQKF